MTQRLQDYVELHDETLTTVLLKNFASPQHSSPLSASPRDFDDRHRRQSSAASSSSMDRIEALDAMPDETTDAGLTAASKGKRKSAKKQRMEKIIPMGPALVRAVQSRKQLPLDFSRFSSLESEAPVPSRKRKGSVCESSEKRVRLDPEEESGGGPRIRNVVRFVGYGAKALGKKQGHFSTDIEKEVMEGGEKEVMEREERVKERVKGDDEQDLELSVAGTRLLRCPGRVLPGGDYLCDLCDDPMPNRISLVNHLLKVHTVEYQCLFRCELCSEVLSRSIEYTVHMVTRHGIKPKLGQRRWVSGHRGVQKTSPTLSGEAGWKCSECQVTLPTQQGAFSHLKRIHGFLKKKDAECHKEAVEGGEAKKEAVEGGEAKKEAVEGGEAKKEATPEKDKILDREKMKAKAANTPVCVILNRLSNVDIEDALRRGWKKEDGDLKKKKKKRRSLLKEMEGDEVREQGREEVEGEMEEGLKKKKRRRSLLQELEGGEGEMEGEGKEEVLEEESNEKNRSMSKDMEEGREEKEEGEKEEGKKGEETEDIDGGERQDMERNGEENMAAKAGCPMTPEPMDQGIKSGEAPMSPDLVDSDPGSPPLDQTPLPDFRSLLSMMVPKCKNTEVPGEDMVETAVDEDMVEVAVDEVVAESVEASMTTPVVLKKTFEAEDVETFHETDGRPFSDSEDEQEVLQEEINAVVFPEVKEPVPEPVKEATSVVIDEEDVANEVIAPGPSEPVPEPVGDSVDVGDEDTSEEDVMLDTWCKTKKRRRSEEDEEWVPEFKKFQTKSKKSKKKDADPPSKREEDEEWVPEFEKFQTKSKKSKKKDADSPSKREEDEEWVPEFEKFQTKSKNSKKKDADSPSKREPLKSESDDKVSEVGSRSFVPYYSDHIYFNHRSSPSKKFSFTPRSSPSKKFSFTPPKPTKRKNLVRELDSAVESVQPDVDLKVGKKNVRSQKNYQGIKSRKNGLIPVKQFTPKASVPPPLKRLYKIPSGVTVTTTTKKSNDSPQESNDSSRESSSLPNGLASRSFTIDPTLPFSKPSIFTPRGTSLVSSTAKSRFPTPNGIRKLQGSSSPKSSVQLIPATQTRPFPPTVRILQSKSSPQTRPRQSLPLQIQATPAPVQTHAIPASHVDATARTPTPGQTNATASLPVHATPVHVQAHSTASPVHAPSDLLAHATASPVEARATISPVHATPFSTAQATPSPPVSLGVAEQTFPSKSKQPHPLPLPNAFPKDPPDGVQSLVRPKPKVVDDPDDEDDMSEDEEESSNSDNEPDLLIRLGYFTSTDLVLRRQGFSVITPESQSVGQLCFSCGSAGQSCFIYCISCAQPFHLFCLSTPPSPQEERNGWACPRCRSCFICGRLGPGGNCERCRKSYHLACNRWILELCHEYLMGPRIRVAGKRQRKRCLSCINRCDFCGRGLVPRHAQLISEPFCTSRCARLHRSGNFCCRCKAGYTDQGTDQTAMLECSRCHEWIHPSCEGLTEAEMLECSRCHEWIHPSCEGLTEAEFAFLSTPAFDIGDFVCRVCSRQGGQPLWLAAIVDKEKEAVEGILVRGTL
ncbi:unnamed protein product [Cyprideis torosa]|uniref:Uncharacterized protein n=1 Tax=Cyprideis torosa TaxID=163714 RepID=A0A7R8WPQ8_9CRUS|nr:unnamed protein product [Cyprideis torosa]CAG0901585.1 unnamed protein product [Cyprideis torosa]